MCRRYLVERQANNNFRASNKEPHRGFGYVEFSLAEDAREAIDNMDQAELYGRVIKCNQAKPQKDANEGLGSRTAVWEQVSILHRFSLSFQVQSAVAGFANAMFTGRLCCQV